MNSSSISCLSRRGFLRHVAGSAVAVGLGGGALRAEQPAARAAIPRLKPQREHKLCGWDSMAERNIFGKRSADEGRTWSEPKQISKPGWYCTNNDHVLRLKSGRILLPAHTVLGGGPFQMTGSKLESFVYLSDDEGR